MGIPHNNTQAFGIMIRALRRKTLRSYEQFAALGAPSDRYQKSIESGAEMPLTDETLEKYAAAFEAVDSDVSASLLFALAESTHEEKIYQRGEHQADLEKDPLYVGSEGFRLGFQHEHSRVVNAGALKYPESGPAHTLAALSSRTSFVEVSSRIAARHTALTLVPWPVAQASRQLRGGEPWISYLIYRVGLYTDMGYPRATIDPLTGITTLERAYERAAAMGAEGADRSHLAWAVLLANADAAATGGTPLASWISAASDSATSIVIAESGRRRVTVRQRWREQMSAMGASTWTTITGLEPAKEVKEHVNAFAITSTPSSATDLESAGEANKAKVIDDRTGSQPSSGEQPVMMSVEAIIERAAPYLLPWAEEWLIAHRLRFGVNQHEKSPHIDWQADSFDPAESGPGEHPQPRMWFYDDTAIPALPNVLASQEIPNLVMGNRQLTATGCYGPDYTWCPGGVTDRFAVVMEAGTGTWRAVRLY